MITLYYIARTRALRPRWLLEELSVAYRLVAMTFADTEHPDYRRIQPHGLVPALVEDEMVIHESSAICAWLAERFPERGLAPALEDRVARAQYLQWLFYAQVTLEPPVTQLMFMKWPHEARDGRPALAHNEVLAAGTRKWFAHLATPLAEHVRTREFLVGDRLSAADIVVGGVLVWAEAMGLFTPDSTLAHYIGRLKARPAYEAARLPPPAT